MESLTAAEVVGPHAGGARRPRRVRRARERELQSPPRPSHAAGAAFHHARHEGGAICMADGYARVSGRVGVCSRPPGTGLHQRDDGPDRGGQGRGRRCCWSAGEAPAAALRSNFRLDQAALATTVGAAPDRASGASAAATPRGRAPRAGRAPAGPAQLPLDVQYASRPAPQPSRQPRAPHAPAPSPEAIAEVAALMRRRPAGRVIIAGRGGAVGRARGARGARRRPSAPARHLRDGPRAVRRLAVGGGDLGRASPRRSPRPACIADLRPRARVRRVAHPLDDARRLALIAPAAKVVHGRPPPGSPQTEPAIARPACAATAAAAALLGRRRAGSPVVAQPTRWPAEIAAGSWRDDPYEDAGARRPHGPADALDRPRRAARRATGPSPSTPATSWASRRVPARPRSRRLRVHAGLPVGRPRPGERDRRRHRAPPDA